MAALPYHSADAKRSYVRAAFTAIAPRYDLLNHVLSLNVDRRWRRQAVDALGWERIPRGMYLDLCAGTMDLGLDLAGRPGFGGGVVGADFVVPMLRLGRRKGPAVRAVGADALALPFPPRRFDGCVVGFGIRNLADVDAGLREIARVLKPGGRLVILDFAMPTAWPIRPLYLFYFRHLLPRVGRVVSKHRDAYAYLPASVAEFASPEEMRDRLSVVGFRNVGFQKLTFGVAALIWGEAA